MTNKWQSELGCEVNHCTAEWCNESRLNVCALRQAYLERGRYLESLVKELGDSNLKASAELIKALQEMEWIGLQNVINE